MENGMIHVNDLREMDKIAASMEEDYTLEDLIQAVECKEDFTRPHSFVFTKSKETIGDDEYIKCENCGKEFAWRDWNPCWNYCPFCGLPVVDFEEED